MMILNLLPQNHIATQASKATLSYSPNSTATNIPQIQKPLEMDLYSFSQKQRSEGTPDPGVGHNFTRNAFDSTASKVHLSSPAGNKKGHSNKAALYFAGKHDLPEDVKSALEQACKPPKYSSVDEFMRQSRLQQVADEKMKQWVKDEIESVQEPEAQKNTRNSLYNAARKHSTAYAQEKDYIPYRPTQPASIKARESKLRTTRRQKDLKQCKDTLTNKEAIKDELLYALELMNYQLNILQNERDNRRRANNSALKASTSSGQNRPSLSLRDHVHSSVKKALDAKTENVQTLRLILSQAVAEVEDTHAKKSARSTISALSALSHDSDIPKSFKTPRLKPESKESISIASDRAPLNTTTPLNLHMTDWLEGEDDPFVSGHSKVKLPENLDMGVDMLEADQLLASSGVKKRPRYNYDETLTDFDNTIDSDSSTNSIIQGLEDQINRMQIDENKDEDDIVKLLKRTVRKMKQKKS